MEVEMRGACVEDIKEQRLPDALARCLRVWRGVPRQLFPVATE
jgi:hypothetical protein